MSGFLLFSIVVCSKCVFGANILHLATQPIPSHHIFNKALAYGLVERGHNVTYVCTEDDQSDKPDNFTYIFQDGVHRKLNAIYNMNSMTSWTPLTMLFNFQTWSTAQCKFNLESQGYKRVLNYPPDFKFDLIIFDVTGGSCFYPMIKHFGYPPSVALTPFLLPHFVSYSLGNMLFPSFIPWYGFSYSTNMDFWQRLWNTLFTYIDVYYRIYNQYEEETKLAVEAFGSDIPSMVDLERHFSILLANTNPLIDHAQPLSPNIIPVAGLHIKKPKPLTQKLQHLLDNSANGVIIFSLGTNIRSDKLDKPIQEALLKAFSQLKETVLWKFESDIENLPRNVFVMKWLPQGDLLAHRNIRLFFGHGGSLSTQEAVFHGVPLAIMPFLVDQNIMAKIVVQRKIGVELDFKKITAGYVLSKMKEVLDNPKYSHNMKKVSQAFRDSPQTPLERGVFWTEYVLRNGGANFLSMPSRDMPFYKSTGLDVLLFLLVLLAVSFIVLYKIGVLLLKLFFRTKKLKEN